MHIFCFACPNWNKQKWLRSYLKSYVNSIYILKKVSSIIKYPANYRSISLFECKNIYVYLLLTTVLPLPIIMASYNRRANNFRLCVLNKKNNRSLILWWILLLCNRTMVKSIQITGFIYLQKLEFLFMILMQSYPR